MFTVNITFVLSIGVLVMSENDLLRRQTIRFYVFEGCPDYPNTTVYYSYVKIRTISRTVYLDMKINIKEDIKSDNTQLVLDMKRCQSRDALNSCESYKTIKLNNFCNIITGDNKPWSPFRSRFTPPLPGCPFKKGVYEVKNGTFDVSKFPHIPISNIYWKIKVFIKTTPGGEVILCNLVEGQIAPA